MTVDIFKKEVAAYADSINSFKVAFCTELGPNKIAIPFTAMERIIDAALEKYAYLCLCYDTINDPTMKNLYKEFRTNGRPDLYNKILEFVNYCKELYPTSETVNQTADKFIAKISPKEYLMKDPRAATFRIHRDLQLEHNKVKIVKFLEDYRQKLGFDIKNYEKGEAPDFEPLTNCIKSAETKQSELQDMITYINQSFK